jgi:hypothetical protein
MRDDGRIFVQRQALFALHPDADAEWVPWLIDGGGAKKYGWWDESTQSLAAHIVQSPGGRASSGSTMAEGSAE